MPQRVAQRGVRRTTASWARLDELRRFARSAAARPLAMAPAMKQIIAVVKPFMAEKVLDALKRSPLEALYVREVRGYGRQKSYLDQYSDTEFSEAFLPKVEISMWVEDDRCEEIIQKVVAAARTGRIGDGKILVLPAALADAQF